MEATRQESPTTGSTAGSANMPPTLEHMLQKLGPNTVFGTPVEKGEITVIPLAEANFGLGFGGGQGEDAEQERGSGFGGGGGGKIRPRGYIEITPDGTRYYPTVDATRLALGSMALAGFVVYAWLRFGPSDE